MIGALIDGAIKRRKVVLGVTLIACIFGFFSYLAMQDDAEDRLVGEALLLDDRRLGVGREAAAR